MVKLVTSMRYEDRLDGFTNYSPWKERIKLMFLVNMKWEYSVKEIQKPRDPKDLEAYKEFDAKENIIILDGVKDHLIPHLTGKNIAQEMWKALQDLFQNKNKNQFLVFREKLKSTKMWDGKGVALYLT